MVDDEVDDEQALDVIVAFVDEIDEVVNVFLIILVAL